VFTGATWQIKLNDVWTVQKINGITDRDVTLIHSFVYIIRYEPDLNIAILIVKY